MARSCRQALARFWKVILLSRAISLAVHSSADFPRAEAATTNLKPSSGCSPRLSFYFLVLRHDHVIRWVWSACPVTRTLTQKLGNDSFHILTHWPPARIPLKVRQKESLYHYARAEDLRSRLYSASVAADISVLQRWAGNKN